MSEEQVEGRATMVRERDQRAETHPSLPGNMLGEQPLVHAGAVVRDCRLGAWTEIGPGWSLLGTDFGDYSYAAGTDGVIQYAQIGKFCSIAGHVVINPGDHRWIASRNTI